MQDFTGEWDIDRGATRLTVMEVGSIESAAMTIRMDDGVFQLRRTFVIDGETHEAGFSAPLDGTETVREDPERTLRLSVRPEKEDWVFTARIEEAVGESMNVVRYRLLDGGRRLEAEEHFRGPALSYDNLWVFERRPQPA